MALSPPISSYSLDRDRTGPWLQRQSHGNCGGAQHGCQDKEQAVGSRLASPAVLCLGLDLCIAVAAGIIVCAPRGGVGADEVAANKVIRADAGTLSAVTTVVVAPGVVLVVVVDAGGGNAARKGPGGLCAIAAALSGEERRRHLFEYRIGAAAAFGQSGACAYVRGVVSPQRRPAGGVRHHARHSNPRTVAENLIPNMS